MAGLLALAALVLAGCGTSGDDAGAGDRLEGDVTVSGSSTVEPISIRVAELFEDIEPDVVVNVDGPGTGDGFKLFCEGETDISDASRAIKAEEAETCEENGIEFVELKIAFDGISVVTSPKNKLDCLNFADLYALIGPESQGFERWSDATALAKELGSTTALPDGPLDITAPGEESGTYDSFIELALADIAEARVEQGKLEEVDVESSRPDYSSQSDDNAIITGVKGSSTALGWVGFAFAEEAGTSIRELAVSAEPSGDCVSPSRDTIADGSYPLSRPLFIYVSKTAAEDNPAVRAYVDFYLDEGMAAVEEVGYVRLPDEQFKATVDAWN